MIINIIDIRDCSDDIKFFPTLPSSSYLKVLIVIITLIIIINTITVITTASYSWSWSWSSSSSSQHLGLEGFWMGVPAEVLLGAASRPPLHPPVHRSVQFRIRVHGAQRTAGGYPPHWQDLSHPHASPQVAERIEFCWRSSNFDQALFWYPFFEIML